MTKQTLLEQLRISLQDTKKTEYPDSELLTYLADTIEYLSTMLASIHSSYTRKSVWVTQSPIETPHDFLSASKKTTDITLYDNHIVFEVVPTTFEYYKRFELPANLEATLDIPQEFMPAIKQDVINKALNRNEYSITLEEQYKQQFLMAAIEISKKRDGIITDADRKLKYEV